jgi:hypothetical protein
MYVVRNKKTKEIIQMMNSTPGENLKPEQVLPSFDPKTMEFGRYREQHLPAEFTIKDGEVLSDEEESEESFKEMKARYLANASKQAFQQRLALVPDHEMMNAALGIYPEKRTKQIQATVRKFRDEYKRYEAAVEKVKTVKDLEALNKGYLKFPEKLLGPEE